VAVSNTVVFDMVTAHTQPTPDDLRREIAFVDDPDVVLLEPVGLNAPLHERFLRRVIPYTRIFCKISISATGALFLATVPTGHRPSFNADDVVEFPGPVEKR
jgi:hypothetical protein